MVTPPVPVLPKEGPLVYRLEKEFRFEASHQLPKHDGKCRRLHGHSWVGRIVVEGDRLSTDGPKTGMLIDYGDLGQAVAPLVDQYLDHHHLNETTGLENPTSEELARWIYDRLKPRIGLLKEVRVLETCTSECVYRP